MRARLVPSRAAALVFVGGLGVVLALVLASESARVPLRTPLVPGAARGEPLPIPLEGRETRHGSRLFRLTLSLGDPAALASHEELWLFLSSETEPLAPRGGPAARARVGVCPHGARSGRRCGADQPTRVRTLAGLLDHRRARRRREHGPGGRGEGRRCGRAAGLSTVERRRAGQDPGPALRHEARRARRSRPLRVVSGQRAPHRAAEPHVAPLAGCGLAGRRSCAPESRSHWPVASSSRRDPSPAAPARPPPRSRFAQGRAARSSLRASRCSTRW